METVFGMIFALLVTGFGWLNAERRVEEERQRRRAAEYNAQAQKDMSDAMGMAQRRAADPDRVRSGAAAYDRD